MHANIGHFSQIAGYPDDDWRYTIGLRRRRH
jgi:hypothetical protein